jgi:hypothetical protein
LPKDVHVSAENLHTCNVKVMLPSHVSMLPVRRFGGCVALVTLLAWTMETAPGLLAAAPELVLNLRMTTTQELPLATRAALMSETESIWKDGHIRLRWVDDSSQADPALALRVVVMARAVPPVGKAAAWAVGELVQHEGSRALAIASLTGAQRVLDQTRFQLLDHPTVHDRRLGVVLGRALAHEIGHYLLQTKTHASRGLMRAQVDVTEFADLRSATFRIDAAARAHLAALAARGELPAQAPGFSYDAR